MRPLRVGLLRRGLLDFRRFHIDVPDDHRVRRVKALIEAKSSLQCFDRGPVFVSYKSDDCPARPRSPGTSGSVEVVLVVGRGVEVHDTGHVINVDSAGGDIGRDQRLDFSIFECRQRSLALRLGSASMNSGSVDTHGGQLSRKPIGAVPSATEHDGAVVAFNQARGELHTLVPCCRPEQVLDTRAIIVGVDVVAAGVVLVTAYEHVDLAVEGCREQHGLAIRASGVEDPPDGGKESHVGHTVGFVDHRDVDVFEVNVTPGYQVFQATGSGDDDVGSVAQCFALWFIPRASVYGDDAAVSGGRKRGKFGRHLGSQLTSGDQHKPTRTTGLAVSYPQDQRQAESEGLA